MISSSVPGMVRRDRFRFGSGSIPPLLGVAGIATLLGAWWSGINVNLFYLAYVASAYVAAIVLLRPVKAKLAALAALVFFAFYAPAPAPPLPPEQMVLDKTFVPPGTSRSYRFVTGVLRERQADCGPLRRGEVHVQGENLVAGLRSDQGVIADQQVRPLYAMQRLDAVIDLPSDIPDELRLSLDNRGPAALAILRGPEISGRDLYLDGVYLIFRTELCGVVLHGNAVEGLR